MNKEETLSSPPGMKRRIHFNYPQLIGMPFLLLLPVLAVLGSFGPENNQVVISNAELEVHAEYPVRLRYRRSAVIRISAENHSPYDLSVIQINFDKNYLDHFSQVTFTPEVSEITASGYVVRFKNVSAGETRSLSIDLESSQPGRWEGVILLSASEHPDIRIPVSTRILP